MRLTGMLSVHQVPSSRPRAAGAAGGGRARLWRAGCRIAGGRVCGDIQNMCTCGALHANGCNTDEPVCLDNMYIRTSSTGV